jgi:hypothetical protein
LEEGELNQLPMSFGQRLVGEPETTTLLETKEFCGAAWPSKVLKGRGTFLRE